MSKKYETEEAIQTHPSQDNTGRFAVDQLLRSYGFKIVSRPRNCSPVWERNGKEFKQAGALRLIDRRKVQDAQYQEDLYEDYGCELEG